MKKIGLYIFTAWLSYLNLSFSQVQEGEKYWVFKQDINDGLSQNIVISINEDTNGMMWIGTLDGINVFDGSYFREVGVLDESKGNNNDYYEIYADKDGSIWTKRDDGLRRFDLQSKKWDYSDILKKSYGLYMMPDGRRVVYILDEGFMWMHNPREFSKFENFCTHGKTMRNPVIQYHDEDQILYALGNEGEIVKYDLINQTCQLDTQLVELGSNFLDMEIIEDELWIISNSNKMFTMDLDMKNIRSVGELFKSYQVERFNDFFFDKKTKTLWLAADRKGIFSYDVAQKTWKHHEVKLIDDPQGEQEYVIKIFANSKGKMYFGSTTNGLLISDPKQINFYKIPEVSLVGQRLYNLKLPRKMVSDDKGDIWIGTTGQGIWRYNRELNKTDHYTVESHPQMLRSNGAKQLLVDGDDLWVGYNGLGADLIDINTLQRKKSFPLYDPAFSETTIINDFIKSEDETIWIGTEYKGVYGIKGDEITHLHQGNSGLDYNRIYNIKEINGNIVLTNFLGIMYILDPIEKKISKIKTNLEEFSYSIKCITNDSQGNIWIGTGGQGIYLLDKNWQSIDTFSLERGDLLNNEICNIIEDKFNHIWVGSNKGLTHFVKKGKSFVSKKIYTQKNGLLSNEFMTGAYVAEEDFLWMGTIDGINYWDPELMNESEEELELYFHEIKSNSEVLYQDFYGDEEPLIFGPSYNDLSITFGTKGFVDGDRIQYQTWLAGFDDDWSAPSSRNYVNYTNIAPGVYQFKVKSTNYDGVWGTNVQTLNFEIQSSITQKSWFLFLVGLLILGAVLFVGKSYARYRDIQEAKKVSVERELALMEMQSLRAQINPHFLFNTMSSINNFILKNEKDIASFYLVKFSKLIRKILQFTTKKSISLQDELDTLELYIEIEQMRLGESFDYFINSKISDQNDIMVPPLILQPFVENAIWHGLTHKQGDKILTIEINTNRKNLVIKIIDNGIGRKKSSAMQSKEKTRSYGISITKKRIELWDKLAESRTEESIIFKDLVDDSGLSLGTEASIVLPIVQRKTVQHQKKDSLKTLQLTKT